MAAVVSPLKAGSDCSESSEPDRFKRLVTRHLPALQRRARWLAGDHDQAQDLIQECLLRAWRNLHRLRSEAAARGWLYQILHREHLRAVSRVAARGDASLEDYHLATIAGGDSGRQAEAGLDLRSIMRALPVALRRPLLLSAIAGHSNGEIAKRLELSENAVSIRLHRARRLARELAEV